MAEPIKRVDKSEAHYRDTPNAGQRCMDCSMFKPPHGCTKVLGGVNYHGWCKYFDPKRRRDA